MTTYQDEVRAAYDRDPEREWARLVTGAQARLEFEITRHVLNRHLPSPPVHVLDAGGGPGRYALLLAERGYMVTLLDLSPVLIDRARSRITQATRAVRERIEALVEGSITDLSAFPDASFDAVLCLGGPVSHLVDPRDRERALGELRRVATPGAPIIVSVMNRLAVFRSAVQWLGYFDQLRAPFPATGLARIGPHRAPAFFYTLEGLRGELERAGLEIIRLYGSNGIGAQLQEENVLAILEDEDRWFIWRELLLATCDEPSIVGVSNHLIAVTTSNP